MAVLKCSCLLFNHDVNYLAHVLQLFVIPQLAQSSSSCNHALIFNMKTKFDFSSSLTVSYVCNDARPLSSIVWHNLKAGVGSTPLTKSFLDILHCRPGIPTNVR